jgi:exo-1,4-beta-D-glucosaminidase
MRLRCFLCLSIILAPYLMPTEQRSANAQQPYATISLKDNWTLQSSSNVDQTGDALSTASSTAQGWYGIAAPSTVVAALVRNQVYPDPFFGMNLRSFPGMSYKIGANFSTIAMPQDSPFAVPWWYRNEFVLPASFKDKTIWLKFGGINYRADIWLNGTQIATSEDVAGAWRTYEFDITAVAQPGKTNALAVLVYPPAETDLAITFVDWNPQPPDKNMGIWRGVQIAASGPVSLRHPAVLAKVNSPANDTARLTVAALLKNAASHPVRGTLRGTIDAIEFAQDVELAAGESRDVVFESGKFPQLNFINPRLWWPAQMGTPNLYSLRIEFIVNGAVSDQAETSFGIREITSELNAAKARVFSVNGKKILIRGGGWTSGMLLKENPSRMEDEFRYVRDMGLNTIRLEGKLETDEFFDLADRYGILIMAGWCCCDHWEQWSKWTDRDRRIAKESLRSQMYRLRSHPSLLMWLNGSDGPPPADIEKMYLSVEQQCRWPNPIVSSAAAKATTATGLSGVKMTGPYEYVAPAYWLEDTKNGGAYGFNTETSPGPAVPPIESLREMLPKEHLWPIDDWWNFHAGGGNFKDIHVFTEALNARWGVAAGVEDFALKSQLMTYEGIRAMFEAYSRNKYTSTGVIQWMLNNAWPSMIWHLYDFYLRPGGGYFGAKKALEPLHAMYSYNDRSVWLVSSQYQNARGLRLSAKILNMNMTKRFAREVALDAAADSTNKVMVLPELSDVSPVYFVSLRLSDAAGKTISSNLYWLSARKETLAWNKSNWYVTPTSTYADFSALRQLPKVTLKISSRTEPIGQESVTHVMLENPSRSLAFFIRLKVNKGNGGPEVLPVIWQDNYFSLLPGEKREVSAIYRTQDLGNAAPTVELSGWNLKKPAIGK